MTELLKQAFDQVSNLSKIEQDRIAQSLINLMATDAGEEVIPPEHRAAVLEGLAQLDRGEFFSEDEVEAMLAEILE
jgi:predicted transcriptional regulator